MPVGISMNGAVPFQEAENIMLIWINGIAMIVHTVLLSVMTVKCLLPGTADSVALAEPAKRLP